MGNIFGKQLAQTRGFYVHLAIPHTVDHVEIHHLSVCEGVLRWPVNRKIGTQNCVGVDLSIFAAVVLFAPRADDVAVRLDFVFRFLFGDSVSAWRASTL